MKSLKTVKVAVFVHVKLKMEIKLKLVATFGLKVLLCFASTTANLLHFTCISVSCLPAVISLLLSFL